MKKIVYRILCISLFIVAIFTIKSYGISDFTYTLDDSGNATITAYNGSESSLTIPSTIDGYNVTTVGSHAFDESRNSTNGHTIKNVVISEGIKRIELLAFAKCTNLESVKLPESLTFLDMQTFTQCSNLKSINIPSKIENIANGTFQETGFTEFDIPENVKSIDSRALGICSSLEEVRVYSKDITYDLGVFEYSSSNLVLYGYEGSTTQTYAQQNELQFRLLTDNEDDIPITSISLNQSSLLLYVGNTEILVANILPNNANDTTLVWSSNNSSVATVENGKVIAKSIGFATITVSNEDGTKKATCNITVTKKEATSEKTTDTTVANGKLPQTGISHIVLIILFLIFIVMILSYRHYKNLKDI